LLAELGDILRKEGLTMNYSKPEVNLLGEAAAVIQGNPKTGLPGDTVGDTSHSIAAYDLDE